MRVELIVDELVQLIAEGKKDERLAWFDDGCRVRVLVSRIIQGKFRQTIQGRRKRFRQALDKKLLVTGWGKVRGARDLYERNVAKLSDAG